MPVQISLNPAGTIHGRNTKVRGAYRVFPYGIPCAFYASGPGAGNAFTGMVDVRRNLPTPRSILALSTSANQASFSMWPQDSTKALPVLVIT